MNLLKGKEIAHHIDYATNSADTLALTLNRLVNNAEKREEAQLMALKINAQVNLAKLEGAL